MPNRSLQTFEPTRLRAAVSELELQLQPGDLGIS